MQVRGISRDDGIGEKKDVIVQFVQGPLESSLFLEEAVLHQQTSRVQPTNDSSEFLNEGLMDPLFRISEGEAILPKRNNFRRTNTAS